MSLIESDALSSIYPKENTKPQFRSGLDPASRLEARQELLRYYRAKPDFLGSPVDGDSFKDIVEFIEGINVDPAIGEAELRQHFPVSEPTVADNIFLHRVAVINDFLLENRDAVSVDTCNYRHVIAVAENTVSVGGQEFTIGGVGASGAYELHHMLEKGEIMMLQDAILEALIISGIPIGNMTPTEQDRLVVMIQAEASKMIQEKQPPTLSDQDRKDWQAWYQAAVKDILNGNFEFVTNEEPPKALNVDSYGIATQLLAASENCKTYSMSAIACAQKIVDSLGIQIQIDPSYVYCAMHKYIDRDEKYREAGLQRPGERGRLACISHCGETLAEERIAVSLIIPLMLNEGTVYLTGIKKYGKNTVYDNRRPYKWATDLTDFQYLTPSRNDPDTLREKHLIIENGLSLDSFAKKRDKRSFRHVGSALRGIDLSPYDAIFIHTKKSAEIPLDYEPKEIYVEGISRGKTGPDRIERIATLAAKDVRRISMSEIDIPRRERIWSSAPPCLHCLNGFKYSDVIETMYINSIPWDELKNDDGLGLEALTQIPVRTVVLN